MDSSKSDAQKSTNYTNNFTYLVSGSSAQQLAEPVAGPIIKPLLGKAVVPDDSAYTTGGIGLLGTAPSQDAMADCDTLVIAGSSFPYLEFYPKPGKAKTVQIDLDPARIGLRHPADVGLVGDCRDVLGALLPLIARKEDRSFLEQAQRWRAKQSLLDSICVSPFWGYCLGSFRECVAVRNFATTGARSIGRSPSVCARAIHGSISDWLGGDTLSLTI